MSQRAGGLVLPGGGVEESDIQDSSLSRTLFGSSGTLFRELREEIGLRGWDRTIVTHFAEWYPVGCFLWWYRDPTGRLTPRFDAVVSAVLTRSAGPIGLVVEFPPDPDILGHAWFPLNVFHPGTRRLAMGGYWNRVLPNTAAELAHYRQTRKGDCPPGFGLIEVGTRT